jgi:hypothetical protein
VNRTLACTSDLSGCCASQRVLEVGAAEDPGSRAQPDRSAEVPGAREYDARVPVCDRVDPVYARTQLSGNVVGVIQQGCQRGTHHAVAVLGVY